MIIGGLSSNQVLYSFEDEWKWCVYFVARMIFCEKSKKGQPLQVVLFRDVRIVCKSLYVFLSQLEGNRDSKPNSYGFVPLHSRYPFGHGFYDPNSFL